jgi:hypothetical protein
MLDIEAEYWVMSETPNSGLLEPGFKNMQLD